MSDHDWQSQEVAWYLKHGAHVEDRIVNDSRGHPYVIGDHSWHAKGRPIEYIERSMTGTLLAVEYDER